jgi:hypothetical protein
VQSGTRAAVDDALAGGYSGAAMSVKTIQLGQIWRNNSDGKNYLVTKLYSELFTQFAMLRQADAQAANVPTVRVKVDKSADAATLPGYTYAQDSQDF